MATGTPRGKKLARHVSENLRAYNVRMAQSSLRVRTFGDRMTTFREFRRRTGSWPLLSMSTHFARYVLMLAIISLVFWYGRQHPDSPGQAMLAFLVAAPLFILLWTVLESFVWNYELRARRLTDRGTFLTVKQFPE
jgi:Flp pilus assembly protein TadB